MPPKASGKAAAAKPASAKGKAKAKAKATSKATKDAPDNHHSNNNNNNNSGNGSVAAGAAFQEVDIPTETLRRIIPKDAGFQHAVHDKVRLVNNKCRVAFSRGCKGVTWFTTTVEECGSSAAALRMARSMFLKLEEGASKEEVLEYKEECCTQLQAYIASLSGPPPTPLLGELAASTPSTEDRSKGLKRPHSETTSPAAIWEASRRSSVSSAASPYLGNQNLERAAPPSVASTVDTETESIKLANNEAKSKIIHSKEGILRQRGIVGSSEAPACKGDTATEEPDTRQSSNSSSTDQEKEKEKESTEQEREVAQMGTSDGIASTESSRSNGAEEAQSTGDMQQQQQQHHQEQTETMLTVAHTPQHDGKAEDISKATPAAGRVSTGKPARDAVSFQSGVRSLKESLTAQNLDTSGSWSELVARLEKAEAEGPVTAPTPSQAPPGPGIGSRSPGASGRSPATGGRTPKQTTPKLARISYAFRLQKRLASKRPPATPQRLGPNGV